MKKKPIIFLISIISLLSITVIVYGTARPPFGDDHDACHDSTGYTIDSTITGENPANPSSNIVFNITAAGTNLFIQVHPEAKDNSLFTISPTTDRINDSTLYDIDPNPNSIKVEFNITTPAVEGYYTIFIIAGDNSSGQINFAYLEFYINIGEVTPPGPEINIFDHYGTLLGIPALVLLTVATILVLVNENKFVKIHGIFAGSSWILTLVNVFTLLLKDPAGWWSFPLGFHVSHIILGGVGLTAGFFSMLFGIAAERRPAKLLGYVTLICWWVAFFLGLILVPQF